VSAPRRLRALLSLAAVTVAAAGCSDADAEGGPALGRLVPGPTVELSRSGGCAEVWLWAADESGAVVVSVVADLSDRSALEPTTITATLPDDSVEVEVLHGSDLTANLCTDVLDPASEPSTTSPAIEGRVEVTVDPVRDHADACGRTAATFRIDGLVADDGTTFAPISGASDEIGCTSG